MANRFSKIVAIFTIFCMLLTTTSTFAGPGGKKKKKMGFFAKISKALKKAAKKVKNAAKKAAKKTGDAIKGAVVKTGQAIKTGGAKIVNAGMDGWTAFKKKVTGKKTKTWVCGHYDKNGKWTKGHWKKLTPKGKGSGNAPGQSSGASFSGGDYSDDYSGGGYSPYEPGVDPYEPEDPAPPAYDPGMPGDGAGMPDGSFSGDDTGDTADPVLPDLPDEGLPEQDQGQADQTGQADQAGQAGQAGQVAQTDQAAFMGYEMGSKTMGQLMDELVRESYEITEFKRQADPTETYSEEIQNNLNEIYQSREENAQMLIRVIVWDLQANDGQAGKYYNYFVGRMDGMDPEKRQLIIDVVDRVKDGIRHGAGHVAEDSEKAVYGRRLQEMEKY